VVGGHWPTSAAEGQLTGALLPDTDRSPMVGSGQTSTQHSDSLIYRCATQTCRIPNDLIRFSVAMGEIIRA
jgi:hypothetical protein